MGKLVRQATGDKEQKAEAALSRIRFAAWAKLPASIEAYR
jgi:hypothetical protein